MSLRRRYEYRSPYSLVAIEPAWGGWRWYATPVTLAPDPPMQSGFSLTRARAKNNADAWCRIWARQAGRHPWQL